MSKLNNPACKLIHYFIQFQRARDATPCGKEGVGCFGTCDIFTRRSGVLTGGSVAATFYRVLHVMECPQETGRQKQEKCAKMMHKTEKETCTPLEKLIY